MRFIDVPMIPVAGKKGGKNPYRYPFPFRIEIPATTSEHGIKTGAKIGALIHLNGSTQEKAAEEMNVNESLVSRTVTGKTVVLDRMSEYARVTGVPDERYLYTNKDYKKMKTDQEKRDACEVEAFGIRIGDALYEIEPERRKELMKFIEDFIKLEKKKK